MPRQVGVLTSWQPGLRDSYCARMLGPGRNEPPTGALISNKKGPEKLRDQIAQELEKYP
jgi:hypothetical protein